MTLLTYFLVITVRDGWSPTAPGSPKLGRLAPSTLFATFHTLLDTFVMTTIDAVLMPRGGSHGGDHVELDDH